MVHAETQTCSPVNTPLWADEQFAFLEFVAQPDSAVHDGQQTKAESGNEPQTWSKVCNIPAGLRLGKFGSVALSDKLGQYTDSFVVAS